MAIDLDDTFVIARETSLELNSAMVRLVQERWSEPFQEHHVAAFASLADALGEDGYQSPRF